MANLDLFVEILPAHNINCVSTWRRMPFQSFTERLLCCAADRLTISAQSRHASLLVVCCRVCEPHDDIVPRLPHSNSHLLRCGS